MDFLNGFAVFIVTIVYSVVVLVIAYHGIIRPLLRMFDDY